VIEYPRDLPVLLITLDFFYESTVKKLGSVPVVVLGPRAVRAKFPGNIILLYQFLYAYGMPGNI